MKKEKSSQGELSDEFKALEQQNQQLQDRLRHCLSELSDDSISLEVYRSLVELAADAILLGNPQGGIIGANQSASQLSGYRLDELVGMNIAALFSAEESHRVPLRYDLLKAGQAVKTERLLIRKDGTSVAVEMNSKMMPDGTYHSFIRDVSERKAAEKALRLSEEKFARAFKLSPDAVNINRAADGCYLEVNKGFCDLLGWSAEEVIGHSSCPDGLDIWCRSEDRQRLLAGLRETGEVSGLEAPFRHKDGRVVIGLMSARLIEIDGEQCILSITRDITERVRLQEQQKKLEEQMLQAQKLESLGVLAGGIAHDFNNILMAVLGHCELALKRLPKEQPAYRNLEQIKNSANAAADLANQMLAYSGKGKFVVEQVDLSWLVKEMQPMLAISIKKKALLQFDLEDGLPSVEADLAQLRQVLLNLVINASDALEEKSGAIAVSTGVADCDRGTLQQTSVDDDLPAGRYVFLQVADTGCGMDEATQQRIFEPFFTTKFSGRGLGMAAVLGIVRGHHGAIKVDTARGQGTTIRVLLPATGSAANQPSDKTTLESFRATGTVLLVDDDLNVLGAGREMLEELGFEVLTAGDGLDAVNLFRQHPARFRFVLMDLTMPRMDGNEAMREMRRLDPQVKVVISSGYHEQLLPKDDADVSPNRFLKKPYLLDDLQTLVQELLQD